MIYKSDNQIKDALGINNWRNLLSDKFIRFNEMMPEMDNLLMVSIICDLPQFWHFAQQTLQKLAAQHQMVADAVLASRLLELRRFIDRDLVLEDCSPAERTHYLDTIRMLLENNPLTTVLSEADSQYVSRLQGCQGCKTRSLLIALLSFIGNRIR